MKGRTILGTLLVIVGAAALTFVLLGDKSRMERIASWKGQDVYIERAVDASSLSNIDIKSGSTNVKLVKGSGDQVRINVEGQATKEYADDIKLQTESRGDRLHVEIDNNTGFRIGINWTKITMTVDIPDKQWSQLNVDVGNGDIALSDMAWDTVDLEAGSGNVTIEKMSVTELDTKVSSGNVKIEDISGEHFVLKTSNGNIRVDGYEAYTIKFDVGNGNVKFNDGVAELDGKSSSGNIDLVTQDLIRHTTLTTSSGNVTIDLDRTPESLAVSYRGGSGVGRVEKEGFRYEDTRDEDDIEGAFGSGEIKLQVETGSGNFTLK